MPNGDIAKKNSVAERPSKPIQLSISELSARTACGIETLRYYERIGLVPPPPRTEGRHRLYGPEHLHRVQFIRRARELDFSLEDVRALLRLTDGGAPPCGEAREISRRHLEAIRQKIEALRQTEAQLTELVSRCAAGSSERCPILAELTKPL